MTISFSNVIKIVEKHLKKLRRAGLEAFIVALCSLPPPRTSKKQIQKEDLEGKTPKEVAENIMKAYTTRSGPNKVREALTKINENQIRLGLQRDLRAAGKKNKKTPSKAKTAPRSGGGQVGVVDQKPNVGASKGSKPLKSKEPNGDIKPQTVKAQTTGGAASRKRKREKENEEEPEPRRPRNQQTSDKKHFVIENRNKLIKLITLVDPVLDDLMDKELLTQEQYDIIRKKSTDQDKMRELFCFVRSWGPKENNTFLVILGKHNPVVIKNLKQKK